MPHGLKRYQNLDHDHLITISCYHRRPYLQTPESRDLFERSLEQTRRKYHFEILAYVVMPEHVHLLVSEPSTEPLAKAMQALKVSVSKQSLQRPFWQVRYHDFNVFTQPKRFQKIRYIHRNPVARGLVIEPEHWPHSSYLTYLHREQRTAQIATAEGKLEFQGYDGFCNPRPHHAEVLDTCCTLAQHKTPQEPAHQRVPVHGSSGQPRTRSPDLILLE